MSNSYAKAYWNDYGAHLLSRTSMSMYYLKINGVLPAVLSDAL